MPSLISKSIAKLRPLFKGLQAKKFLTVTLAALILLTTNAAPSLSNQAVSSKLDEVVHQEDSQRPKTTGEWNQEAQETQGAPGERLKRIGKQSAEAVKDFASVYPDTAKRSASELQDGNKTSE